MNMADRPEDIDYEPDVLKFINLWNEGKNTTKSKLANTSSQETFKQKSKIEPRTKEKSRQKEKSQEINKHTVLSEKNVVRNPKQNPEKIVEIVTQPQAFYTDSLKNQKNNVHKGTLIQTAVSTSGIGELIDLKRAVKEKDYELSLLRVSNTRNEDRIRCLEQKIAVKDDKIFELESRERELISRNNALCNSEKIFDYGKVEYENFKNDSRRLLKMLQTTNEYQQFSNLALDDNGVRFLNSVNQKIKSSLDTKEKSVLHFCTCNKEFIPESAFWVPEKVYDYGKEFIKERQGELTQAELELLLYDLNKIWREREKRIINTHNSLKAKEVDQLKRKIALHKANSTKN